VVCPPDHCLSCLERLAQGIEHLRMKFRKLVEEEQAEMGERCLAGTWTRAAADERRHACRMVRLAEGPRPADAPSGKVAREAPDHADLEHLKRF
jgi:hypothetical protein